MTQSYQTKKGSILMESMQLLYAIILLSCYLLGCADAEDSIAQGEVAVAGSNAHFVIVSKNTGLKSYGSPYISITVKNIGNKTGYLVSCDVYAKQGNVIMDTGWASFANGNNIQSGESASDDAIFFKLDSHDQYDTLEYDLDWLTRQ